MRCWRMASSSGSSCCVFESRFFEFFFFGKREEEEVEKKRSTKKRFFVRSSAGLFRALARSLSLSLFYCARGEASIVLLRSVRQKRTEAETHHA